ncbi:MAG: hypothetical protein MJE68_23940, partial [Proteobacteria bacterium]|nr:hypothetical protein [Pseudomonadota bacterium]
IVVFGITYKAICISYIYIYIYNMHNLQKAQKRATSSFNDDEEDDLPSFDVSSNVCYFVSYVHVRGHYIILY